MSNETVGVSMSVSVEDGVSRELAKLASRITDLDAALKDMGASLETETKMRFESEKDPAGDDWAPLAKSTLEKRGRTGEGGKAAILQAQRHLFESIGYKVETGVGAMVGTSMVYGRIHQLGGRAGRGHKTKIEARPFLGLSEDGKVEMVAILRDHLARGAR